MQLSLQLSLQLCYVISKRMPLTQNVKMLSCLPLTRNMLQVDTIAQRALSSLFLCTYIKNVQHLN